MAEIHKQYAYALASHAGLRVGKTYAYAMVEATPEVYVGQAGMHVLEAATVEEAVVGQAGMQVLQKVPDTFVPRPYRLSGHTVMFGNLDRVIYAPMMEKHRYWRLFISQNNGNTAATTIREIEFRETIGGPDLTGGGTASASSRHWQNPPENAFDDNTATYWETDVIQHFDCWVGYDFGEDNFVTVNEVVITASGNAAPRYIALEYSDDGVDWFPRAYIDDQTGWDVGSPRVFNGSSWRLPVSSETALNAYVLAQMTGSRVTQLNAYAITTPSGARLSSLNTYVIAKEVE